MDTIQQLTGIPSVQALGVVLLSVLCAWFSELVIARVLVAAAQRTETDVDDAIVETLRRPVFMSVLIYGLSWTAQLLSMPDTFHGPVVSVLQTLVVLIWTTAIVRISTLVMQSRSKHARRRAMLQPKTLPVFDMVMRVVVVAAGIYFIFLAWNIDLTAWLASAGILGIAVGFAAKDTLGNLFSGIFILADGPYKVKDWIVLENGLRGEVTHIGFRSTRVLTPDDVQITVPNAVMGNVQVLNETGGPQVHQRVRVEFGVAYGSVVEEVRRVVLACLDGVPHILTTPTPVVRFRALGDSALLFEAWVWIENPRVREAVVDEVTSRVYEALNQAEIAIPFPQADIHIKEAPVGNRPLLGRA